ncbi:MAG: LptA/OstA family protein [Pseudomonadota bacterium]
MLKAWLFAVALIAAPLGAGAAGTDVAFSGLQVDPSQPVKVVADRLSVNQTDGTAVFTGNVVVTQGTMTLQTAHLQIEYAQDKKSIARMLADGGVKMATGTEAASSQDAEYAPETGDLIMRGDVVLTQGASAISGPLLTMSLKTGLGTMEGRVTAVFTPTQAPQN